MGGSRNKQHEAISHIVTAVADSKGRHPINTMASEKTRWGQCCDWHMGGGSGLGLHSRPDPAHAAAAVMLPERPAVLFRLNSGLAVTLGFEGERGLRW